MKKVHDDGDLDLETEKGERLFKIGQDFVQRVKKLRMNVAHATLPPTAAPAPSAAQAGQKTSVKVSSNNFAPQQQQQQQQQQQDSFNAPAAKKTVVCKPHPPPRCVG